MKNTPNEAVTEPLITEALDIVIISGEGENGTREYYEGDRSAPAIIERLETERCGGDRWAILEIDGLRIE